jgi:ABC-type phosphate/phosphonate transport system substrate-binding protein
MRNVRAHHAILILIALASVSFGADDKKSDTPRTLHVGIIASFYRDHAEETVKTTIESFKELMLAQTGFQGDPIKVESVDRLAEDLEKDRMQLGVFFGHEFAWVREKHPDLKPLVIVVNQLQYQRCYLLVRNDVKLSSFADLKGKSLAIARHTPEPCHLFLERKCQEAGGKAESFFSKITNPDNVEVALDDLVDGSAQAIIVDEVALTAYKRRKPGRFAKLKELEKSPVFPAAVVTYRPDKWNDADLTTIKDALLNAHQNPEGRQLLTMWKLTGFEPVPEDYEKQLKSIVEVYPPAKGKD